MAQPTLPTTAACLWTLHNTSHDLLSHAQAGGEEEVVARFARLPQSGHCPSGPQSPRWTLSRCGEEGGAEADQERFLRECCGEEGFGSGADVLGCTTAELPKVKEKRAYAEWLSAHDPACKGVPDTPQS